MSATDTVQQHPANPLTGFVSVEVKTLRLTKADAVDLFVQYEPHCEPMLYCRAGARPSDEQFAELEESGVEQLYVRNDDFFNFSSDLMESLGDLLQQDDISKADKFAALQLAVAVEIEQTLRLVDCSKFRALADKIGHDLVALLAGAKCCPANCFELPGTISTRLRTSRTLPATA